MANEYKITGKINKTDVENIIKRIKTSPFFDIYYLDFVYLLKQNGNVVVSVFVEIDKIQIVQFISSNVWYQIEFIKEYLENNKIEYEINEL